MNKLSAISYLLHRMLTAFGYVDINDGGDVYRVLYDATNPVANEAQPLAKGETLISCERLYDAMEKALEVTRSVEECQIYCGKDGETEWFLCSHFNQHDEEIIDSYVTEFAENVSEEYEMQSVEDSLKEALEFMRNGESAGDWYDLWNEGCFAEAARAWPEAPLSINYFSDSLMFCPEK